MRLRLVAVGLTVALGLSMAAALVAPPAAHAYEFEIEAKTVGQGYQLRWFRFSERDRLLNRRRFTQYLNLNIYDILAPSIDPGYPDKRKKALFDLYFSSSMRFDNDFGNYEQGTTTYPTAMGPTTEDAPSAIPELRNYDLNLDVLYAFVGGRKLFGLLDFQLGRQLTVDTLDWFAFDGLSLRARTPWWFAVEAHGGLLVRDSSPLGAYQQEPDGTSSSECFGFDGEGWIGPVNDSRCAQREEPMPTFGFAAETYGLRKVQARVSYRRVVSRTSDEILQVSSFFGEVDVAANSTFAPPWGVNEEKLMGTLRGNFFAGGVVPWVTARWNFLLAQADEAQAGVRVAWAEHAITPEVWYSYPSFDGDSIFNIFSTEPYTDWRVTYDVWPGRGRLRGYSRGWYRIFENTDTDTLCTAGNCGMGVTTGMAIASDARARGVGVGARLRLDARSRVRADLFYEDGYGGLRAGGDTSGRYTLTRDLEAEGRVSLIRFEEDSLTDLKATTFGLQAGARYKLAHEMALHLLVEENINRYETSQFRLMGVLDLAFHPEF